MAAVALDLHTLKITICSHFTFIHSFTPNTMLNKIFGDEVNCLRCEKHASNKQLLTTFKRPIFDTYTERIWNGFSSSSSSSENKLYFQSKLINLKHLK